MRIRRVTEKDFNFVEELDQYYENDLILYHEQLESEKEFKEQLFFDEDVLAQIQFTEERFKNCIDSSCYKQYILEDDEENPIGYMFLSELTQYKWQLEILLIEKESQTLEVFTQFFQELKKEKDISEVYVVLLEEVIQEKFKKIGFEPCRLVNHMSVLFEIYIL